MSVELFEGLGPDRRIRLVTQLSRSGYGVRHLRAAAGDAALHAARRLRGRRGASLGQPSLPCSCVEGTPLR